MRKLNKNAICATVIVLLLICFAVFLRNMGHNVNTPNGSFIIGVLRGLTYICLFASWGASVRRRILQVQVRRYLTAICALMVFWVLVRSMKFQIISDLTLIRYCWYSYYFPMLFIPLLVLLVALSLGKPEGFRLPKWADCLFLVSAALFVLVLTNDFHQLAFGFPKGLLFFENDEYSHELFYFLSMGWIALCTVSALAVMNVKCHLPGNKKMIWLPFVPVVALILYAVLYVSAWNIIKPIAGDMTVVSCLLITATLESCIQCGLIQSNTYYTELFECSGIHARIFDEDYNVLLSSSDTELFSKEMMRRTQIAPVMLDNGFRLCGAPIKRGYVVWSEDVSEMTDVLSELTDNSEYLTTRRAVLHKKVETRKKELHLIEQNRLYNRLINDNQDEYMLFSELISQIEATNDTEKAKMLTAKLAVVCTHIKRRGNLLFLSERGEKINASELRFALEEWLSNLRLCGVKCDLYFSMNSTLSFFKTVSLYDTFQRVLLHVIDTLHSLLVTVGEKNGEPYLLLNLMCECDLSKLACSAISITDEDDGELIITISIPKGDDAE